MRVWRPRREPKEKWPMGEWVFVSVCLVYRCTWWTTPGLFWPSGKVSGLCTGWWAACTSAGCTAQGGPGGCCQHLTDSRRGEERKSGLKWTQLISQWVSLNTKASAETTCLYLVDAEQPGCPASSGRRRSPRLTASVAEGSWWLLRSVSPPCLQTPGDQTSDQSKDNTPNTRHPTNISNFIVPSYPFRLTLLRVLHADSALAVKENLCGHAAHLCLQVGTRQRRPQVGAGGAPPFPWAAMQRMETLLEVQQTLKGGVNKQ